MFGNGSRGNALELVERNGSSSEIDRRLMLFGTSNVRQEQVKATTTRRIHQQEAAVRQATASEIDADAAELIAERITSGDAAASKYQVSLESIRGLYEEMASAGDLLSAHELVYAELIKTHRAAMIDTMKSYLTNHQNIEDGVDTDIAAAKGAYEVIDGRGAHGKTQRRTNAGRFDVEQD